MIIIKDTEEGINSEIAPRLLTKFTTTSDVGTGLGLCPKVLLKPMEGYCGLKIILMEKVLHLVLPSHGFQMTRTKVTEITMAIGGVIE